MKKFTLNRFFLLSLAFCLLSTAIFAQEEKKEESSKQKMLIIKKTIDKDGNEKVEKIVKEGMDAEGMIWISDDGETIELEGNDFEFLDENDLPEFDNIESIDVIKLKPGEAIPEDAKERLKALGVDVEQLDMGKHTIRIMKGDGDKEQRVIEWEGTMDEAEVEKLKSEGIYIEQFDGNGGRSIKLRTEKSNSDRPFMGIMMNKTVEVVNENGEETETVTTGDGDGITIGGVVEGSGAANAGLQEGDIIHKVDGQEMNLFGDLTTIIEDKAIGDVLEVEYERNGSPATTTVTLGAQQDIEIGNIDEDIEIHIDIDSDMDNDFIHMEDINVDNDSEERIVIIRTKEASSDEALPMEVDVNLERSLDLQELDIFPNPTKGELTVAFTAPAENTTIKITDISGKEIYTERLNNFDGVYRNTLDLGKAAKGTLLLSIQQKDKVFTEKIILK